MGPLTPILMPRCVNSAAETTFSLKVLVALLLLCWLAMLGFGLLLLLAAAEIWGGFHFFYDIQISLRCMLIHR